MKAKACDRLAQAGNRAASLAAAAEARRWFEQALELADDPLARAGLHERAAETALATGDGDAAKAHFRQAMELFGGGGERHAAARAAAGHAEVVWLQEGGVDEAHRQGWKRPTQHSLERTPDADLARLAAELGRLLYFAGRPEAAGAPRGRLCGSPRASSCRRSSRRRSTASRLWLGAQGRHEEAPPSPAPRPPGGARQRPRQCGASRLQQPLRRLLERGSPRGRASGAEAGRRTRPPARQPPLGDEPERMPHLAADHARPLGRGVSPGARRLEQGVLAGTARLAVGARSPSSQSTSTGASSSPLKELAELMPDAEGSSLQVRGAVPLSARSARQRGRRRLPGGALARRRCARACCNGAGRRDRGCRSNGSRPRPRSADMGKLAELVAIFERKLPGAMPPLTQAQLARFAGSPRAPERRRGRRRGRFQARRRTVPRARRTVLARRLVARAGGGAGPSGAVRRRPSRFWPRRGRSSSASRPGRGSSGSSTCGRPPR